MSNKEYKEEILNQSEDLIKYIRKFFEKSNSKLDDVESIILFGSYASNRSTNESDIDICLVFKEQVSRIRENKIHDLILDLSKQLERNIDVLYIHPEHIEKFDHTVMESILAQGRLIYGTNEYEDLFLKHINLHPYLAISFSLRHLDSSGKMKFTRMLYGYETSVEHSGKNYQYERPGLLEKLNGRRLGSGMILIPEEKFSIFENKVKRFDIKFASFRVWKQDI